MSALESPHLLLPLEKPTDRRAANPAVAQAVQAESAGGGRAAATRLPAKDPLGPQREPALPQVDVDFKPAERRAHFHCLKPPRVWYLLWPLYPPPPTPVRSWLITRLFSMALA